MMKRVASANGMHVLPVKRGSSQPPNRPGADKSAAYTLPSVAEEYIGAEEYLGVEEAFGITKKDSLYVGKMACGDWGPRLRSLPPGPNNWEVSFQWQKVEPGRQGKYTRSISDVVSDLSTKFCSKTYEDETSDVSGLYFSDVILVSDTPPPQFGTTTFYWQEPCHATHHYEIVENLDESIKRQCLHLMGGMLDENEPQS